MDGPIDEAQWWNAQVRVLFMSKDCNDSRQVMKPVGYDLCRLLREIDRNSKHSRTFQRELGRWAHAIHQFSVGRTVSYDAISPQDAAKALLSTAVMNVKKLAGTSNANDAELKAAVARDNLRILKQIEILSPTVVVCCGTFKYLKGGVPDLEKTARATRCFRQNHVYWIDQWHPSFRFAKGGAPAMFSRLMEAVTGINFS
jgi:hypothetical protein